MFNKISETLIFNHMIVNYLFFFGYTVMGFEALILHRMDWVVVSLSIE